VTRLDAMRGASRRAVHAANVRATSAAVIDALSDDLRPDVPNDREDLARLIGIIGESWESSLNFSFSSAEQMRWSAVCGAAQQIAERLQGEVDAENEAAKTVTEASRAARRSSKVIRLRRRT
jgi:hypothetical protein